MKQHLDIYKQIDNLIVKSYILHATVVIEKLQREYQRN